MMPTYRGIPGWFDFADYYAEIVQRMPDGASLVEVGTLFGASAACLHDLLVDSEKEFSLELVDSFIERKDFNEEIGEIRARYGSYRKAFDHFALGCGLSLDSRVKVSQMDSTNAAFAHEDKSLDFVFLDGCHNNPQFTRDLEAWGPKVKRGGLLSGHDLSPHFPDIEWSLNKVYPGRYARKSYACWEVML